MNKLEKKEEFKEVTKESMDIILAAFNSSKFIEVLGDTMDSVAQLFNLATMACQKMEDTFQSVSQIMQTVMSGVALMTNGAPPPKSKKYRLIDYRLLAYTKMSDNMIEVHFEFCSSQYKLYGDLIDRHYIPMICKECHGWVLKDYDDGKLEVSSRGNVVYIKYLGKYEQMNELERVMTTMRIL